MLDLLGALILIGSIGALDAAGPVIPSPILPSASLDLTWAVTGLVALALAEAFEVGRRLIDDVTGLI